MTENKNLPQFDSVDELIAFFDENDFGEFENDLPEAHFEVDLKKRRHFVGIDEEINKELTEIAAREKTSTESLINLWLKEKISSYAEINK
ncbi:MAG TPA: CopG family antitoxin [Pyrinomonadaceae bacterium]|nr:CopG family antitoxin [Pyrinomonadaceae bacterium]